MLMSSAEGDNYKKRELSLHPLGNLAAVNKEVNDLFGKLFAICIAFTYIYGYCVFYT